jgi:hypothetical protein
MALANALAVLAQALLCNLYADGSPPGTDEALAEWRAAARRAGAVPALRSLVALPRGSASGFPLIAASAAALLELPGRGLDDLAAAGDAPQQAPRRGAPASAEVMVQYDPVVEPATETLLAGLEGAPARSGNAPTHPHAGPAHRAKSRGAPANE